MVTFQGIDAAFAALDPAPAVAAEDDAKDPACWELRSRLSEARMPWRELAAPGRMEILSTDAAEWTGCLPPTWFLYYLPAMMARTLHPQTSFEHNLLGCLLQYLDPNRYATDRHLAVVQLIYASMSEGQRSIVTDFVANHQASDGRAGSDA